MSRPGGTMRRRLVRGLGAALRFAALCAVVLVPVVGFSLYSKGFGALPRTAIALAVLALPPALAGGLVTYAVAVFMPRMGSALRGATMLFGLFAIGPLASIAAFGFAYRLGYPGHSAALLSKSGLLDAAWTVVSATYLFLIFAPLLYLPWTPVAGLALAVYFALRRPRH